MTPPLWLAGPAALWAVYTWGSYLYKPRTIWRGRHPGPLAALTFDDGPDAVHTPRILDALAREGVAATFFMIGRRAAALPDLARRVASEGHDMGNHTWSHKSLWLAGPRDTEREIARGHEAISEAAGQPPRFFRPPWGMSNLALFPVIERLGTPCVFWTLQPERRKAVPPSVQETRVVERVTPGAIVDLHDADGVPGAGGRTAEALPGMIQGLRARGYTLARLSDLL